MNDQNEHADRMVDMLLCELVGNQRPPNLKDRVLEAAERKESMERPMARMASKPIILKSARWSAAPAFAIAALLAILAVAGALLHFDRIASSRNPVLTTIKDGQETFRGAIAAGDGIATESDERALLSYRDGTRVELDSDTAVKVAKRWPWDAQKGIEEVRGGIKAEVGPQPENRPMLFVSESARCEVLGTALSFQAGQALSRLEVTEGRVRFSSIGSGEQVVVESGHFAEVGAGGFLHGQTVEPTTPGIRRFVLMNAVTDEPIRPLVHGDVLKLSSLPTDRVNIRAEFDGDPPESVTTLIFRQRGHPTGLEPKTARHHLHPPYFVAGSHGDEGRPDDCAEWAPPTGLYNLIGTAIYEDPTKQKLSQPLKIKFRIIR